MLGDVSKAEKLYVACGYTDMRKSIDGLAILVQQNFQLNPFQNSLFLFCGRKRDRLKALYWEGDGFLLLYKQLENGNFQWPMTPEAIRTITIQEFRWLNRIGDLEKENKRLQETIQFLTQKLYGRSTEKTSALPIGIEQLSLFDEAETEAAPSAPEPDLKEVSSYQRKKNKGGREELLKDIPHH